MLVWVKNCLSTSRGSNLSNCPVPMDLNPLLYTHHNHLPYFVCQACQFRDSPQTILSALGHLSSF